MPLKPSSWILSALRCRHVIGLATLLLLPVLLPGCSDSERSNTAPSPAAAAITIMGQTRATTQVQPGDPDPGQGHTFAITTAPAHGSSSVDATGLVTYEPQATFIGTDSLVVTVTDDGHPPLAGTVTVRITVTAPPGPTLKATVTFPGPSALLTYTPLTVRGTAQGSHVITRVTVDGVQATSTDGFATWEATVPLALGMNTLVVSLEDERGNSEAHAATAVITRVAPLFATPSGIAVEAQGTLVVTDERLGAVFRVQPATGTRTILSDIATGTGPAFMTPRAIAVEASGQLVVVDAARRAILRVDPNTGTRTIVSDETRGSGPTLRTPIGIAVALSGQLVVVDQALWAVLLIDPVTGTRTVFSDRNTANDPLFTPRGSVAVEASGTLVIGVPSSVLRVDPATGERTVVAASLPGSPALATESIAVAANGQLFVAGPTPRVSNNAADAIFDSSYEEFIRVTRVDPVTGRSANVANIVTGSGPPLRHLRGLTVAPNGQLLVTTDKGLLQIDPETGNRTKIAHDALGSGAPLTDPLDTAVTADGQLVVATAGYLLHHVDTTTSARTIIADLSTPSPAPVFVPRTFPHSVAVEATGQLAVARSLHGTLSRVDPTTGAHVIVADTTTGSGATLGSPVSIAVAADGQWLVATEVSERVGIDVRNRPRILRVNPSTGVRTLVADCSSNNSPMHGLALETTGRLAVVRGNSSVFGGASSLQNGIWGVAPGTGSCVAMTGGSGVELVAPRGVAVEASGHLVVLDSGRAAVLRLDPVTWNRTIVSDLTVGRGPLLSSFGPLLLRAIGVTPAPVALLFNDGIAVEATGNLLVADPSLDAILRIDARSGDRAIISR